MDKEKKTTGGITFTGVLTILLIALKLTGYITWSWGWVLAPLWLPTLIAIVVLVIVSVITRLLKTVGK